VLIELGPILAQEAQHIQNDGGKMKQHEAYRNPKNQYQELKSQLSQFGLNPDDWRLKQEKSNQFLIFNHEDSSFKLVGLTSSKTKVQKWECIHILDQ